MNEDGAIARGYPAGTYERVLVITKPDADGLTLKVVNEIADFCKENEVPWTRDSNKFPDGTGKVLLVAVGGDGTMLGAMRDSLRYPKSIVYGVNTGTLGFLVEEYRNNIRQVLSDISRRFGMVEERMALSGRIYVDGDLVEDDQVAMNEFVLAPMTIQAPISTEVYINKKLVSDNKGSGVLVATSTGSTALASSGGGAIVSPSTNIMQVVPILAHTLTSRPVITTGRDTISLKTEIGNNRNPIEVYADGVVLATIYNDDGNEVELRVTKNPNPVRIYRPADWDFFNVLREKMKW
jgi:NAD+ kinase